MLGQRRRRWPNIKTAVCSTGHARDDSWGRLARNISLACPRVVCRKQLHRPLNEWFGCSNLMITPCRVGEGVALLSAFLIFL